MQLLDLDYDILNIIGEYVKQDINVELKKKKILKKLIIS
jgi:hypothetical protein